MGLIQAQDYLGALWAVGLRLQSAGEADIEHALAARQLVRTWPARGTLHFVAAADLRWVLALLGPRAVRASAGRFRRLELDEAVFARSRRIITAALQGGKMLARGEIYRMLETQQVSTAGQRGIHILWRLALEGLLCFGPRQGKQHTFVLLDEWLPAAANSRSADESLAELALRYFSSHGPAALQDFTWWSGLSGTQAREALELVKNRLVADGPGKQALWRAPSLPPAAGQAPAAVLLPAFDEYLVGYKERSAVLDPRQVKQINAGGGMLNPVIVIDGQVAGTWKRTLRKQSVSITPAWFDPPGEAGLDAFQAAARRYAAFLGLELSPD